MKTCSKCNETKPLSCFYERIKGSGLYASHCKDCRAKYLQLRYQEKRKDKDWVDKQVNAYKVWYDKKKQDKNWVDAHSQKTSARWKEMMEDHSYAEWYRDYSRRIKKKDYINGRRADPEKAKVSSVGYRGRYPEKAKARYYANNHLETISGLVGHHWSYNKDHYFDVIHLSPEDHYKAHRHMIYDQSEFKYRIKDTGFLLATRSDHERYLGLLNINITHTSWESKTLRSY